MTPGQVGAVRWVMPEGTEVTVCQPRGINCSIRKPVSVGTSFQASETVVERRRVDACWHRTETLERLVGMTPGSDPGIGGLDAILVIRSARDGVVEIVGSVGAGRANDVR